MFLNCESIKTDCDGTILVLESFKNKNLRQSMA